MLADMDSVHSVRSTSLIGSEDHPSKTLMAVHPHRHSTGELEDAVSIDWDRLQLPPRSNACSSSDSLRSSSESHKRSRTSSGNNAPQQDLALAAAEEISERQGKPNAEKANEQQLGENVSSDEVQQMKKILELYEGIFVSVGFTSSENVAKLFAERGRTTKQNAELPLSMRKASLEASQRLNSGAEGRTRYTIDNRFTSVVDKAKDRPEGDRKINKTASMPEIKQSLTVELVGDCLQLPIVHAIPTVTPSSTSTSLYSNPLRYATNSSRMTRKEAVDTQTDVETFAYNQLASIGWW